MPLFPEIKTEWPLSIVSNNRIINRHGTHIKIKIQLPRTEFNPLTSHFVDIQTRLDLLNQTAYLFHVGYEL